jgi:hypothetical protein
MVKIFKLSSKNPMLLDWIPFDISVNTVSLASVCLWSLGLYLSLGKLKLWLIERLQCWFNFAERSLYTSQEEFERTRAAREAQNLFYASLVSILPFFALAIGCNLLVEIGLGHNWALSLGIMAVIIGAVYALGRQDALES